MLHKSSNRDNPPITLPTFSLKFVFVVPVTVLTLNVNPIKQKQELHFSLFSKLKRVSPLISLPPSCYSALQNCDSSVRGMKKYFCQKSEQRMPNVAILKVIAVTEACKSDKTKSDKRKQPGPSCSND